MFQPYKCYKFNGDEKLFTKLLKVVLLILVMLGIEILQSYGQEFKDGGDAG
ncbi:MAG: hypothetical protein U0Z17_00845 [Bacteroidales bacterium]